MGWRTTTNALTQIVNPDGTTANFQYDSLGDLISQAGANGAGQVTYGYPATGTFTETDAAVDTATLIFDTNENLARIKDPLGNITKFQYNSAGDLNGIVTPTGGTSAFTFDSNDNLTGYTDPD